jgi:hypothetical protein
MDPVKGVTFEGSGLTMTFQSDLFTNFNGADFWLFVYDDHTGDVIQQYDLGVPTTDTLIVPSLFQGGFVIPHFNSGGPLKKANKGKYCRALFESTSIEL